MAKLRLSLDEQIAKYTEKAMLLKRKKEEADRRQRKANLDKIGQALEKLDFDLSDITLFTGCMVYAIESMQSTPGFDSELKENGAKFLRLRRGGTSSNDSTTE